MEEDANSQSPLLENNDTAESEFSYSTEQPLIEIEDRINPSGTILSSSINIANTILGSGMLAMPSALAATGLAGGIGMIAIAGCLSALGLFLLGRMAAQVGRKASFNTCASITYPFAAVYFDLAVAVKCFGVSISYLVIVGSLIPQIVAGYWPDIAADSVWRNRETWITISMIIM